MSGGSNFISESPLTPRPAKKSWWTWKKVAALVGVLLLLAVGGFVGWRLYLNHRNEERLKAVLTEIDAKEPDGWRFADLESHRVLIPEERNSAVEVQKVINLFPNPWPARKKEQRDADFFPRSAPHIVDKINELLPDVKLADWQIEEARQALKEAEKALAEARNLAEFPEGRFPLVWPPGSSFPDQSQLVGLNTVSTLLRLDAVVRAQEGNTEGAFLSSRALLNAGRSIGDEPLFTSQLFRLAIQKRTALSLERTLAQGQPADSDLATMCNLLQEEERHPALLIAMRGERAWNHEVMERVKRGELSPTALTQRASSSPAFLGKFGKFFAEAAQSQSLMEDHPGELGWLTEYVEACTLPETEQRGRFEKLERAQTGKLISGKVFWGVMASLRCTWIALTVERYRLLNSHWPDQLDQLVPRFLASIPCDSCDGSLLRFRRLSDGVVIYSVGLDGEDNGGNLDRANPRAEHTDVGFRLWNASERRKPAPTVENSKNHSAAPAKP